jgi:isocitrate/isopropylmalate dehydrogenase
MTKRIAVIPGDGIGPEVIDGGLRILNHPNDAPTSASNSSTSAGTRMSIRAPSQV